MTAYVLAFKTTYAARTAGKTLASGGIDFETVETPARVASLASLGAVSEIALRFVTDDPLPVLQRIFGRAAKTNIAQLYREVSEGEFERDPLL